MNRILCKIGDKTFYVVGEWYDSTGVYAEMILSKHQMDLVYIQSMMVMCCS